MKRFFASITLATGLWCSFSGPAAAWTCAAVGVSGRTATGSAILAERAKGIALRRCERRNASGCTILWCHP